MQIWKILSEVIMGKPPKTYPESIADQLGSKLDHLAQNPKGLQVKELVFRMKSKIEAAQASGYTLDDIVKVFEAEGVALTLNTLKQYLRESRSLPPSSTPSQLPELASKPPKQPKTDARTKSNSMPAQPQSEETPIAEDVKISGTNEEGFQRMRSNDEL